MAGREELPDGEGRRDLRALGHLLYFQGYYNLPEEQRRTVSKRRCPLHRGIWAITKWSVGSHLGPLLSREGRSLSCKQKGLPQVFPDEVEELYRLRTCRKVDLVDVVGVKHRFLDDKAIFALLSVPQ